MNLLNSSIRNFLADEQGATAIEYGLLVALISLVIVAGATLLGANLNALYTKLALCVATPSTCTP
jgi:pilus assembly protein Flp/PilA